MNQRIEDRVKNVIVKALNLEIDPGEIGDDDILFGGEMGLNSMAMIELVVGIEEEFNIEVSDEDLRPEVFESVNTIARYVINTPEGISNTV